MLMQLPELITLETLKGDWSKYLGFIYQSFLKSVVDAKLEFLGKPIRAPWHPPYDGKHYSFWHIISTAGKETGEQNRIPDIRRCERILWIGCVIANATIEEHFKKIWCWQNQREGKRGINTHTILYLHSNRFLIVLREKPDCYQLVTAYTIEQTHHHCKLLKEKEESVDPRKDKGRN
jgi:hypothetical protein